MDNSIVKVKSDSLFRNINFLLLFWGKVVSQIGDSVYGFAISLFILDLTGSAVQMSAYMAVGTVTYVLFAPIGGVLADKFNKVTLVYLMDIIRGLTVGLIGITAYLKAPTYVILIGLYCTAVMLNICAAIFNPTSTSLVPRLVRTDQLTKANSLSQSVNQMSQIFGVFLGGILYSIVGAAGIFIINSISYILSGISEMFIRYDYVKKEKEEKNANTLKSFFGEIKEGLVYLKNDKLMSSIVSFALLLNMAFAPLFGVFVTYIFKELLNAPEIHIAYVQIGFSLGFILGSLIISMIKYENKIATTLRFSITWQWLAVGLLPLALFFRQNNNLSQLGFLIGAISTFIFVGIFNAMSNIPLAVLFQKKVKPEIMGRISSLMSTLSMIAMPIGMLVGGIAADNLPMIPILCIEFVFVGLMVIGIYRSKSFVNEELV